MEKQLLYSACVKLLWKARIICYHKCTIEHYGNVKLYEMYEIEEITMIYH